MTQQNSREDLNLVGEFTIISDIPNNPLVAIVTSLGESDLISVRTDPDTGAITIAPHYGPIIEEMQASQALGLMEDAFNMAVATINNPSANNGDAAIARNRKVHLTSTLKALKKLMPS